MSRRLKIVASKIISPVVILGLRLHTAITGTERARVIVRTEDGEVLLVRGVIGPNWSLPGGGIERSETPRQTAMRELYEETGILMEEERCRLLEVLKSSDLPVNYTAHIFELVITKDMLPKVQYNTHEIIELAWFPLDKLPDDLSSIVQPCLKLLSKP